jgi:hypothetical protein
MTDKPRVAPPRCQALIFKRDTYRYTGCGKSGFEMHYSEEQCSRAAKVGDLCKQHSFRPSISRCKWAREFMEKRNG